MPSTWPGIEPATLGIEGQRYTNLPTRSTYEEGPEVTQDPGPDGDSTSDGRQVEVALGGAVQLQCPAATVGGCWSRVGTGGRLQPVGPGPDLTLDRVLYQEAGEYRCVVERDPAELDQWRADLDVQLIVTERDSEKNRKCMEEILEPQFHSDRQDLNLKLRSGVMNSFILPVLLYGAQTRSLTEREQDMLRKCQRKMERKILNITLRHRLRNEDIRSQTHLKDAAETADKLKKKWTGHVMRLNENRWTHILTTWDPRIGKRNVGKQKTRWADELNQDSAIYGQEQRKTDNNGSSSQSDLQPKQRLRDVGRYLRVAAMKGCITDDHRLFRLAFAEENVKFDSDKDNHRVHTCVEVMTWFSERPCIRLIEWSPCSPDLNVLESVWSEVKKTVNAMVNTMPRRPTTKDALWNIIKNAWDRVSSRRQYLRRLIASIPRRMQAVIDVEGLHTRY
ncbi:hypothetical protein ANN_26075 [Periplaneta americana]|uniref:Ig-like domain-containing protein n=1 Tax=Periplaneta americana TaxID=6978 RepID=A0ABQ8S4Y4_PERAM|nr:hypothetical protein ANN_26075 [Periplaneta americana]